MSEPRTLLPACVDAEISALGSILIDPAAIEQVHAQGVTATDFYSNRNRVIFEAMSRLWNSGSPIDFTLLMDELAGIGKVEESGGAAYIADLIANTPVGMYADHYAAKIKKYSRLRNYIALAGKVTEFAYDGQTGPDELLAYINEELHHMDAGTHDRDALMTWDESFEFSRELLDWYDDRSDTDASAWTWPWASWNKLIDPIEPGMLAVLAAGDGVGKSTFAECIADYWARKGHKVVFVHFELNRRVMMTRRMARHSGHPSRIIKSNQKTDEQRRTIYAAEQRIRTWEGNIHYLHTPGWTIERIIRELSHLHDTGRCDAFVLDYLEKAGTSPTQARRMNETAIEADNVDQIKNFSESREVRCLMLSQLNKSGKQKAAKDLSRTDGRGAGQKSEFSNIYVILHRKKLENGQKNEQGKWLVEPGGYSTQVDVRIDKNTMGATGSFTQYIEQECFAVHDLAE